MIRDFDNLAHRRITSERLQRSWEELCAEYLPLVDSDSIWRYSRTSAAGDLDQGWKLHISATILNAPQILKSIAPLLVKYGVQFKAARSLNDVMSLNSGSLDTYSQVGKIVTVYPRNDDEAVHLAKCLHKRTYRFRAPAVPFDLRFGDTGNVYYRYGAFKKIEIERNGTKIRALKSPSGELAPDVRENPKPNWVCDPFEGIRRTGGLRRPKTLTAHSFPVLRALVQRGKGGVYQAIDLQSNPPRLCLLKEGRRYGELNWNGRDGAWRVRNEERALSQLSRCGIKVPQVYARFKVQGNVYLAMEFVAGESLHSFLIKQKRRLSIRRVLSFGIEIARFVGQMHRAGWAWRDCKPGNFIVTCNGGLVPIDFEGAEQINRPDSSLWGTSGFIPQASREQASHSGLTDDLYALGSILFLLISGQMYDETQPISLTKLRRNVPIDLRMLVESLLACEPQRRPSAQQTLDQLQAILLRCSQTLTLAGRKAA
ncbi:MAG TPA: phosphotransferase [Pyrinomonadaceae bacterium]|nr:phosphotransferase [Pyrinomonadaceae bacterium]